MNERLRDAFINVTRKPFDDIRVRKALAMAIDKKRIVNNITKAGEQVANHFVPLGTADYESPAGIGYDPEQARKLLAEAGYPGGKGFPNFTYLMNNAPIDSQISVELQAMWEKELGVKMEIRQTEWKVYLNEQSKLNFDLSRSSWIGDYNDANHVGAFSDVSPNYQHDVYALDIVQGAGTTVTLRATHAEVSKEITLVEGESFLSLSKNLVHDILYI